MASSPVIKKLCCCCKICTDTDDESEGLISSDTPSRGRERSIEPKYVEALMQEKINKYTDKKEICVFCGTWNVNNQNPPPSLEKWLRIVPAPDIYVIGLQEMDLSKLIYLNKKSKKEKIWKKAFKDGLPDTVSYKKVKIIRLAGIMMLVYAKESIVKDSVDDVDAAMVPTGLFGYLGNKGGVGVRMTLHETSVCFMNTHLAAHQPNTEKRNQDYRVVESETRFRRFALPLKISDHDQIFWIGDLNYRIDDLDIDKVKNMIDKKEYSDLLCYDQLHKQLGGSVVFKDYLEGTPDFRPTYKYDTGTNEWDSSEKSRIPAWCDRILYKGAGIEQVHYISHPDLTISDHKPVSSLFKIEVKVINKEKAKEVKNKILEQQSELENTSQPKVDLNVYEFTFKDVMIFEKQYENLIVTNTGEVPVEFELTKKAEEKLYSSPWLRIGPYKSVIFPDSSYNILLEVLVDETSVATLNASDNLHAKVILKLKGGEDHSITLTGNFILSSFGRPLESLDQMSSVRLLETELPDSPMYTVPKVVWRLVNHILLYGKEEEDLFLHGVLQKDLVDIRNCLDKDTPDEIPGSIHSVAAALLLFLECLPDPVIPNCVYDRCTDPEYSWNPQLCRQIISEIPEHHQHLFYYLCAFLRELLNHSDRNKLDVEFLSTIFGRIFLRSSPNSPPSHARKKELKEEARRTFVSKFLQ